MRTVIIIQARSTSSRLPRKALLPIAGYPSAILAALRAANRGIETILATSDDSSDDALSQLAQKHGLTVFRGALHDVLGRYFRAASQLPDDCAAVRLTADNVLPDGEFVQQLAQAFAAADTDYMSTDHTGLPYGLRGEIFTVAALRRAQKEATLPFDREHVGPWMKRNGRSNSYRPSSSDCSDRGYLRCTIDDQEDYERMVRLFEGVTDPIRAPWAALMSKLARLPGQSAFGIPYRVILDKARSRLTLGTVQLGMDYGAVNDSGQPSPADAVAIVQTAIAHGVTTLDTARSYGTSEEVLGKALSGAWASRCEVITKINLVGLPDTASAHEVRSAVDDQVNRSCAALQFSQLAVVLLHHWADYERWKGTAWHRLLELRDLKKIGILGASLYHPDEALAALRDPAIQHLQIPFNVLDWRWLEAGVDQAVRARPDVIVHARSALLQGVLAHSPGRWPEVPDFRPEQCARILQRLAMDFERENVTDLCLAYVRSQPWITSVVVGCETMRQLEENLRLFCARELTLSQCEQLRRKLPRAPENFLNPSKWKQLEKIATRQ